MNSELIKDGLRFFRRRFGSYTRYEGDADQICKTIVNECWNGKYFQVSNGNFSQFYVRDFAYCAPSLIKLGHKKEVEKTLRYALSQFSKHGKITTTLSPEGVPMDVFGIGPDSLALLMRCLVFLKKKDLVKKYEYFLNTEISRYFWTVFDTDKGIVRENTYFSSAKDNAIRNSSMYDNAMIASLQRDISKLGLQNPFKDYDLKAMLKKRFWTGEYFKDDLNSRHVSADANIYPYWLELFPDSMLRKSIKAIQQEKLDKPFPVKYTSSSKGNFIPYLKALVPNYEGDTIWVHHAMIFIKQVAKVNKKKAKHYIDQYKEKIEEHKNFLELFNPDGTVYKTPFYRSDEGMLWASMYLKWNSPL